MLDLWLTDGWKEVVLLCVGILAIGVVLFLLFKTLLKVIPWLWLKWIKLLARVRWKVRLQIAKTMIGINKLWMKTIWAKRLLKRRHRRRVLMSMKQKRSSALNLLYADMVTNFLEDLLYKNIITKKELHKAYKRFGVGARLPHLISPMSIFLRIGAKDKDAYPVSDQLKGAIRERLKDDDKATMRLPDLDLEEVKRRDIKRNYKQTQGYLKLQEDDGHPDNPLQKIFARK